MAEQPPITLLGRIGWMVGYAFGLSNAAELSSPIPALGQLSQPTKLVHHGIHAGGIARSMTTIATVVRVNGDGNVTGFFLKGRKIRSASSVGVRP